MDISLLFTSGNRSFMRRARCAESGAPSYKFFYTAATREQAKAFCEPCPVREQCLEFALTEVDYGNSDKIVSKLGVWGGKDGKERIIIRNTRNEENNEGEPVNASS